MRLKPQPANMRLYGGLSKSIKRTILSSTVSTLRLTFLFNYILTNAVARLVWCWFTIISEFTGEIVKPVIGIGNPLMHDTSPSGTQPVSVGDFLAEVQDILVTNGLI